MRIRGDFRPRNKGHDDIIAKCSKLFDEVVVALCINVKNRLCFGRKRIEMLEAVVKNIKT